MKFALAILIIILLGCAGDKRKGLLQRKTQTEIQLKIVEREIIPNFNSYLHIIQGAVISNTQVFNSFLNEFNQKKKFDSLVLRRDSLISISNSLQVNLAVTENREVIQELQRVQFDNDFKSSFLEHQKNLRKSLMVNGHDLKSSQILIDSIFSTLVFDQWTPKWFAENKAHTWELLNEQSMRNKY